MDYQPMEPPQRRTISCPDCEGEGLTGEGIDCSECYGDGVIDFDPSDDPYAPDTWKEAEGIA
jgi:DnaJ-class molecular chaperone